jgi:riboflavin-specific deaminase-like protein
VSEDAGAALWPLAASGPLRQAAELLDGVRPDALARPELPYVVVNMVASVDGRAAVAGRTAALGGAADHALFHQLRARADAVLAGSQTVAAERYGRLVRDPALLALRERLNLPAQPLAVIVSGRLSLPADTPLLRDEDARVVVITGPAGELSGHAAQVEYLRSAEDELLLAPHLLRLRRDYGVRLLLCEGGPTLNSALLAEGLVNELFLTVSAYLVGGRDPLTILADGTHEPRALELVWVLRSGADLFLRYRV